MKETITRLDYFAAHAMQGLLANSNLGRVSNVPVTGMALMAREHAVALIEELKDYQPVKEKVKAKVKDKKMLHRGFVFLSVVEYRTLLETLGLTATTEYIIRLDNYLGSTGKKYKSHYHTILTWHRKEGGSTVPEFKDQAELDKRWEEATK